MKIVLSNPYKKLKIVIKLYLFNNIENGDLKKCLQNKLRLWYNWVYKKKK